VAKTGEPILKVIATNRKATHDFTIHERMEAGIQLVGSEVKSLRDAKVTMADGYVEIRKGQAYLHGIQINEYAQANRWGHEVGRVRKLLIVSTDKAIGGRGLMLLQVMTCSSFALP
jgi:SsrA-binding protein